MNDHGQTALYSSLKLSEDDVGVVQAYEKLLRRRKNASIRVAPHVQAAFMWSVDFGTARQVATLLAAGASPNVVFPRGYTPLGRCLTAFNDVERIKVVRLLLDAGADPGVRSEGESPLVIASKQGPSAATRMVFAAGRKGKKFSPRDLNAALRYAAFEGDALFVSDLLKAGAAVNHRGMIDHAILDTAMSALMLATCSGDLDTVRRLLEAGANVNLKDGEGHTALDYVAFHPRAGRKAIPLLERAGAVSGKPFPQRRKKVRRSATAAKDSVFQRAVARIRDLAGVSPLPLRGAENAIPDGFGFVVNEDQARELVARNRSEMIAEGSYLFFTRDRTKTPGPTIGLLPTPDVYKVIEAIGTESSDVSNEDLISWLRQLERDQPFSITGIGLDFIEGRFTTPISDPEGLVQRINKLCPDGDEGPEVAKAQAATLKETGRFFLWWD